jgi:acetyl/propionyl-CoA carboxylase alpha subunit
MIAKLIVHGETREDAAALLGDACREVEVWPVKTNAGFLARCLSHPRFIEGDVDTGFIAAEEDFLLTPARPSSDALAVAAMQLADAEAVEAGSPWESFNNVGFRLNAARNRTVRVGLEGATVTAELPERPDRVVGWATVAGDDWVVFEEGNAFAFSSPRHAGGAGHGAVSDGSLRAPMPGKIVATPTMAGETVAKGAPIVVLEAMKMEHALIAPFDGVVETVGVSVGDQVGEGTVLAVVKAAET